MRRRGIPPFAPLALALAAVALLGPAIGATSCSSRPPAPRAKGEVLRFVLELVPGEAYRTKTRWFLFDVPVYPQVAVWIEDFDGRYLDTLFVTSKAARNAWVSAPARGRPEALPVWSHLKEGPVDAVSAPTRPSGASFDSDLAAKLPPGRYVVKLEANRSYDYNDTWTKDNSGVAGQPSVVYRAELSLGEGPARADFAPVGTGSVDGSDGSVRPGLAGIDSALKLFSRLTIAYR